MTATERAVQECCKPRPIRFSRWGLAEDPTGEIILCAGRLYDCVGSYRREFPSAIMLRVRHFNGEMAEDVAAGACRIVPGHYHEDGL